jgi:hypothetical protein
MRFSWGLGRGVLAGGSVVVVLGGGEGAATGFRLALLPTLWTLRGGVIAVFQRSAGIVSAPCAPRELDLFFRKAAGGVGLVGECSTSLSAGDRAVPPRSGRLLGRSLEKNSVRDLERVLRFAGSGQTEGLSRYRADEPLMAPVACVCRLGEGG